MGNPFNLNLAKGLQFRGARITAGPAFPFQAPPPIKPPAVIPNPNFSALENARVGPYKSLAQRNQTYGLTICTPPVPISTRFRPSICTSFGANTKGNVTVNSGIQLRFGKKW